MDITNAVLDHLNQIAESEGVNVIFACESGSRAWEFASRNSDYDIRFIYGAPINQYITVGTIDTQIQKHVTIDGIGELDFVGWDIGKALALYKNANPQLMEWLQAPIYKDTRNLRDQLLEYLPKFYLRERCYHHYLGMARHNFDEYVLKRESAKIKKYLYILRSLWACNYAVNVQLPMPIPIKFSELRSHPNTPKPDAEIDRIFDIKVNRPAENVSITRSSEIDDYIMGEIMRLEMLRNDWEKLEHRKLTPEQWREEENERIATLDQVFWEMVT